MTEPVAVKVACPCPGTPHTEDTVFLRPALTPAMGAAGLYLIRHLDMSSPNPVADLEGAFAELYLRQGIVDWTLLDEDGGKASLSAGSIAEHLPWARGGSEVVDKAAELYSTDLLGPLVARSLLLLQPGPTGRSTSPRSASGSTRRKRSRRSSLPATAGSKSAVPVP